ncbi:hypothetical protein [Holdemania massiliensis]|uniref:hypothetical protein n=1 Tax=Holdemania massiliensis TaxID=1468449 RepID=UPI00242E6045|nr:hypothetical protein [Holdemania massiliensis]
MPKQNEPVSAQIDLEDKTNKIVKKVFDIMKKENLSIIEYKAVINKLNKAIYGNAKIG